MSKIYYGDRAPGGSLKHYRTKGSRNGYSKNPNYKVVGQRAKGKWVNGRYVYDQPTNNPMYSKSSSQSKGFLSEYSYGAHQRTDPVRDKINEKAAATKMKLASAQGSKNNWQQQAARAQAGLQSTMQGPRTTPSGMGNDPRYTQQVQSQSKPGAASRVKQKARVAKAAAKGAKNDWQQQANATAGMTSAYNNLKDGKIRANNVTGQMDIMQNLYKKQKRSQSKSAKRSDEDENSLAPRTAMGRRVDMMRIVEDPKTGGTRYGTEIIDPRYRVDGTQKIEKAKQEAARKAKEKETKGQYFTLDEKTGRTVKTSPGIEAEKARIEAGKKRHAKVVAKREKAAKRTALINKIKDKISSIFKKKKK